MIPSLAVLRDKGQQFNVSVLNSKHVLHEWSQDPKAPPGDGSLGLYWRKDETSTSFVSGMNCMIYGTKVSVYVAGVDQSQMDTLYRALDIALDRHSRFFGRLEQDVKFFQGRVLDNSI